MPRYSPNINFMMQVSRKISGKLIRDYSELENLQSLIPSAEKFAAASIVRINQMVIDEITKVKSQDNILIEGEKEHIISEDSNQRWCIIPISGLTNFVRSVPYFCFLMSLETKNKEGKFETVATVVEIPILNEVFYAEKNSGAFSSKRRLRISSVKDLASSLIAANSHHNKFGALNIRWNNCLPIELSYVAAGKYDGCVAENSTEIERKSMLLILKESGAKITNLSGSDYNSNDKAFLASNGNIHKELVSKIIK
jgi:myo-inositol-1(or 4)-monophosphatase